VYRYQPPKSNIWGHRLRNMPAAIAKQRFAAFVAATVAEYRFRNATLIITSRDPCLVQRFERRSGLSAPNKLFNMNAVQCDACIDEIIQLEASDLSSAKSLNLAQLLEITEWRIDAQRVPTRSLVTMHYGRIPCLSTLLQFDSIDQFQHIAKAFAAANLCTLNDKHLKLDKNHAKRPKPLMPTRAL
jgi:hypothetical protein